MKGHGRIDYVNGEETENGDAVWSKNWNAPIHRRLHAPPHQGKWLPKNVNEVRCKLTISAHESHLFGLGLRNEQPIKRIMVMQRKLPQDIDMVQFHGEDLEIISRLLSLKVVYLPTADKYRRITRRPS